MLHDNRELFEQIVLRTAEDTGINPAIIEKDYYVTLFLRAIVKELPDIIFKGGTSLSKCYKLIDRFSEDIDLSLDTESIPSEGQRKGLKRAIVSVINSLHFTLVNADDTHSRRAYNKYIIDYPSVFGAKPLKENLIVETSVYLRAYPANRMTASSFIYDYLHHNGYEELIKEYALAPFELNVQTAERTLIDKLFALGDYYLADKVIGHSRHIYDIYKLLTVVDLNGELKALASAVAAERKTHPACLSAQEGVHIASLLQEIVDKEIYKDDYNSITSVLLFEPVEYATAIKGLETVLKSEILDYNNG